MDRVAYLVNSTPAYYYMLPLHFTLVRRYAPFMEHLFLATEVPEHPICVQVANEHGVTLIPLDKKDAGFLASRATALTQLSLSGKFLYVLPVQEDFLIDRVPDLGSLAEGLTILEDSQGLIASARLMPCPGPKGAPMSSRPLWGGLMPSTDEYGFTFQATLWSLEACCAWYAALMGRLEEGWPAASTSPEQRKHIEIRVNIAENADGQHFFWKFFKARKQVHIGWIRAGPWSNAVYMSPWPYRPTAIVQGRLEPWAEELGRREGVPLVSEEKSVRSIGTIGSMYEVGRGY
jgi:hypothetical protein